MWEIAQNSRVLFGCKKIREIAGIFQWHQLKKIFIVTYSADTPALETIKKDLQSKNIGFHIFDKVKTEPDLTVIDLGTEILLGEKCDGVLAIGGGSVLDAGKAIAMLATNGGTIEAYQMAGKSIVENTLPLIAVPTTAGTGSEATKVSVLYNNNNGLKKSVYSHYMIADVAILDPEVTVDLPAGITASTGIDALSHAIESYVSLNANSYSEMYSLKAIELINQSLIKATRDGKDLVARSNMMLGSYMAGCALTAGIGLAHIVAQPFGGVFKIPHGEACSIYLPLSMEINLEYSLKKYRKIGEMLGCSEPSLDDLSIGKQAVKRVNSLIENIGTAKHLSEYTDVTSFNMESALEKIADATGHITCNPRQVNKEILSGIIMKSL